MVTYPEHEKMEAIMNESQRIGEFVDWLQEKGIFLCMYRRTPTPALTSTTGNLRGQGNGVGPDSDEHPRPARGVLLRN